MTIKKFFFPLMTCLLCVPLFGEPWSFFEDFDRPREGSAANFKPGDNYLISSVLAGEAVDLSVELEEKDEKNRKKAEDLLVRAYNEWFAKPAEIIHKAGRAEEFADVLPVLARGINVTFNQKATPDLTVYIVPFSQIISVCGGGSGACYDPEEKELWLPKDNFFLYALSAGRFSTKVTGLHEIGHSLGLADQYQQARSDDSHPVYSSSEPGHGIMNTGRSITCDEADGIVNLIDIVRGSSRGGEYGWRSLCKQSKDVYSHGKPLGRGPYVINRESDGTWSLYSYASGRPFVKQNFEWHSGATLTPLQAFKETAVETDGAGRVVLAAGPDGESVYYSYAYDRKNRLVVKDDKALLAEVISPEWINNRKKYNIHIVHFRIKGRYGKLSVSKSKKDAMLTFEEETSNGRLEQTVLAFDKKGRVTAEQWPEGDNPAKPAGKSSSALVASSLARAVVQTDRRERGSVLRELLITWYRNNCM